MSEISAPLLEEQENMDDIIHTNEALEKITSVSRSTDIEYFKDMKDVSISIKIENI